MYFYSRDRTGGHLAGYSGILQVDAYAGFNDLYAAGRSRIHPANAAGLFQAAAAMMVRQFQGRSWSRREAG